MEANTSNDTSNNDCSSNDTKRQQFTNKQRMDMYAFCVLELEMHSNKVSIKKQQQAIQRVLYGQQKNEQTKDRSLENQNQQLESYQNEQHKGPSSNVSLDRQNEIQMSNVQNQPQPSQSRLDQSQAPVHNQPSPLLPLQNGECSKSNDSTTNNTNITNNNNCPEGKTLLQLQQEVAMSRKCYSDYQRTQVLTSSMLRDVQKRFAKYYPDSAIPSRTTIKHVFEKCVAHGTVENIKTPRKSTKIPQGDEIEYLLIHEPQLSLRQMAQKLNVSTGTVSRRCKALGLIPESVTIKHQQLATARRQKQIKQLESKNKTRSRN